MQVCSTITCKYYNNSCDLFHSFFNFSIVQYNEEQEQIEFAIDCPLTQVLIKMNTKS